MEDGMNIENGSNNVKIEHLAIEKKQLDDNIEESNDTPQYEVVYERQKGLVGNLKNKIAERDKAREERAEIRRHKKTRSSIVIEILSMMTPKANSVTGVTEKQELEYWMHLAQIQKALEGDTNAYREVMNNAYKPHALEIEQRASTPDLSDLSEDELRKFLSEGE
jgi:predicted component of type VI protein secretion system